jgi:hypothetical protein
VEDRSAAAGERDRRERSRPRRARRGQHERDAGAEADHTDGERDRACGRQRLALGREATLEELAEVLAPEDRHLVRSYADDLQELLNLGVTPEEANGVVFAGSAEDAIRFLEGEHAEDTLGELRREGLLCGGSS